MNKKLSSLKRIVFGLKPFISPYKWEFAGAVLMVIISVVTMVSAPSVEGMITTQLASDLSLAESIGKLQVNFDEITKIMLMLAFIYLAKTLSQVFAVIWLTNAIQHAMQDLRNALCDNHDDGITGFFFQLFAQCCIRSEVQCGEGIIKHIDIRLAHQRPGNGKTLLLPTGNIGRSLGDFFLKAMLLFHDEVICLRGFCRLYNLFHGCVRFSKADIVRNRSIEQKGFLRYHT